MSTVAGLGCLATAEQLHRSAFLIVWICFVLDLFDGICCRMIPPEMVMGAGRVGALDLLIKSHWLGYRTENILLKTKTLNYKIKLNINLKYTSKI